MPQNLPIKYLLCAYEFLSNIELSSKAIMSISQYYIGKPYYGQESIKQVMYLQTPHLRVFSSFHRFPDSKSFNHPIELRLIPTVK